MLLLSLHGCCCCTAAVAPHHHRDALEIDFLSVLWVAVVVSASNTTAEECYTVLLLELQLRGGAAGACSQHLHPVSLTEKHFLIVSEIYVGVLETSRRRLLPPDPGDE